MIRNFNRAAIWLMLWLLVRLNAVGLLAWLYSHFVMERISDGTLCRARLEVDKRPTLFMLSAPRFRGEPELLAASGKIRILQISEKWMTRLIYQFFPRALKSRELVRIMNPPNTDPISRCKQRFRIFLAELLPRLYSPFGVDCVVGHSVHIAADIDWGPVSNKLGFPYIVFHRESLLVTPSLQIMVRDRLKPLGQFEGHCVVLHNQATIDTMISSGFVEAGQIRLLGSVRMDSFLEKIERTPAPICDHKRKQVVYFTRYLGKTFERLGLLPWFDEVHVALAKFAMNNPDITVIMKTKPNRGFVTWHNAVKVAYSNAGLRPEEIPNLVMTSEGSANDMILESDVVCSLQSVTLLEAGVSGKPVVVPYFGLITDSKFDDRIYFVDHFDVFDVPQDADDFIRLIEQRMQRPGINPQIMQKRRDLFAEYVASPDGRATRDHIDLINQIVSG